MRILATGASTAALTQAIYVAALFNIIDRIADALDFEVPTDEILAARSRRLESHRHA